MDEGKILSSVMETNKEMEETTISINSTVTSSYPHAAGDVSRGQLQRGKESPSTSLNEVPQVTFVFFFSAHCEPKANLYGIRSVRKYYPSAPIYLFLDMKSANYTVFCARNPPCKIRQSPFLLGRSAPTSDPGRAMKVRFDAVADAFMWSGSQVISQIP